MRHRLGQILARHLARPRAGHSSLPVEADVAEGVRLVPLSLYSGMHTRICRPVGLGPADLDALLEFVRVRLGNACGLRNVFDLLRYLVRVPVRTPRGHAGRSCTSAIIRCSCRGTSTSRRTSGSSNRGWTTASTTAA